MTKNNCDVCQAMFDADFDEETIDAYHDGLISIDYMSKRDREKMFDIYTALDTEADDA